MSDWKFPMENPDYETYATAPEIELQMRVKVENCKSQSDTLTRAIVHLIEGADTGLWQKWDGEIEPHEFYAALLGAIARHYNVDADLPKEATQQEVLEELLKDMRFYNLLQDPIPEIEDE